MLKKFITILNIFIVLSLILLGFSQIILNDNYFRAYNLDNNQKAKELNSLKKSAKNTSIIITSYFEEIKRKYMHYHILSMYMRNGASTVFYQEQIYYKETMERYFPEALATFNVDIFEQAPQEDKVKTLIEEFEKAEVYEEILEFTSALPNKDRYLLLKEA